MDLKRVIKNLTPFILVCVVVVIGAIYFLFTQHSAPEGMGLMFTGSILMLIAVMLVIDIILKRIIKLKTLWVWVAELVLILGLIYYWIVI